MMKKRKLLVRCHVALLSLYVYVRLGSDLGDRVSLMFPNLFWTLGAVNLQMHSGGKFVISNFLLLFQVMDMKGRDRLHTYIL